jgi:hypothetical protein
VNQKTDFLLKLRSMVLEDKTIKFSDNQMDFIGSSCNKIKILDPFEKLDFNYLYSLEQNTFMLILKDEGVKIVEAKRFITLLELMNLQYKFNIPKWEIRIANEK